MELIKCNECIYKPNCPCGYSYCNAACLTIQKKLIQQSKRYTKMEEIKDDKNLTCGNCSSHYISSPYGALSKKYIRCAFEPQWRGHKNSKPTWCPKKDS